MKREQREQVRAQAGSVHGVQQGGLSLSARHRDIRFPELSLYMGERQKEGSYWISTTALRKAQTGDVKLCNRRV